MLKSQLKDKISQDYKKLFAAEEQDVQITIDKIQETMQQIQEDILRKEQADQIEAEKKNEENGGGQMSR
jgi:fructose-1,6-bisphosphatase